MIELDWGGFGTSLVAGRLISQKKPLALTLRGDPAHTLRRVVAPGVTMDRALLKQLAGNFSLTTLPALMLLALGLGYAIAYEALPGEAIRILFNRAPEAGTPFADSGAGSSRGGQPER